MYVHGSEERLIKAAREDKLDSLEAAHVLKKVKKRRDCNIGGESFTWPVFWTNQRRKG